MSDRKQNRTDNGTESLNNEQQAPVSDRLSAIRARLDRRRVDGRAYHPSVEMEVRRDHADFIAHAPADIAYLLDRVEKYRTQLEAEGWIVAD